MINLKKIENIMGIDVKKALSRLRWDDHKRLPGPLDFCRYVYQERAFIAAAIIIFVACFLAGMAVSGAYYDQLMKAMGASEIAQKAGLGLMWGIFWNNASKCFLFGIGGIAFGVLPAFFMFANGLILGIVSSGIVARHGLPYLAAGILPHGVIELPMCFISTGIGLSLGVKLILAVLRREKPRERDLSRALLAFFVWVVPLLFVAAIIETYVTPIIMGMIP